MVIEHAYSNRQCEARLVKLPQLIIRREGMVAARYHAHGS